MKKKGFVIGGLIILAGAAGAGGWYYYKENYGDSAAASGEVAYVTKISTLLGEDSGVLNRFAGVVEPQETVKVNIENNRTVTEVKVKVGDEVKKGQLLFEYDLSSIQDSLKEAQLALDRLKNEALSLNTQISTLEKEKKKANKNNQLSYTIEIETNKMNLKKNEYDQVSKQAEIDKLQAATTNTEVRSEIDGVIQKIVIRLFQALQLLYVPELMRIRSGMELWGLWTSRIQVTAIAAIPIILVDQAMIPQVPVHILFM